MIPLYQRRLQASGVSGYSLEACWQDYRLGVIRAYDLQIYRPEEDRVAVKEWIFANVSAAFDELGCREML